MHEGRSTENSTTMTETQQKPSIDVRTVPPRERHPRIFGLLGTLPAGGSMLITSDHDPRPLHYQLHTNFPGEFGWDYLEEGPEIWRVEIARLGNGSACECCCGSDH
ncbi:DUF2249 domain-containing protein [Sinorhizobium medicae]|nr:DUF2249 domain-containing protein [Sinorhizobium medicae]MDX0825208.1 DUF2249 domain-containing protein [Sinorhizobium medicae]